jgi:DNA-binding transcriptional MerR regulator
MPLPFLKKKPEAFVGKGFIPVDRVKELSSRGFAEPQIVDTLLKEGFSVDEIDKALTQALKTSVAAPAQKKEETKLPTLEEIAKEEKPLEVPETPLAEIEKYAGYPTEERYSTEEYIDYVVQARVAEIVEKIKEFEIKYSELEKRIENIRSQLDEFLKSRSEEQKQILNKIETFNESINDMNIKVGGLEKVFKETLPALIESVRALSELVQRLKKEA